MKNTTSIKFDKEFLDTVRYYLPDREEMKNKIALTLKFLANLEDGVIENSVNVLQFKRNILSIVAAYQHRYYQDIRSDFYVPGWHLDDCAMACAIKIEKYIDEKELPWVEDYVEQQLNCQYWKEHSKRCLTLSDLNKFFGEEV